MGKHGQPIALVGHDWVSQDAPGGLEYVKDFTVEAMFADIEPWLNMKRDRHPMPLSYKGYFTMTYEAAFHPVLGYPTSLHSYPVLEPDATGFVQAESGTSVEELKILKQGPPIPTSIVEP